MAKIVKAELVASRAGNYTMYVFKEVDSGLFIMCTKPPNWQSPQISIGDIGFVKFEEVRAGQSYFKSSEARDDIYKYSGVYFLDFILDNKTIKEKEIIL